MVNRVQLLGRLGKDPIIKHFSNDNSIAEFSLATSDNYKDKEGKLIEVTDWHNIKIPSKGLAGVAEKYLKKGSLVFIEGKIKNRSYDDKDGLKKYVTEIVVENLRMLDKRENTSGSSEQGSGSSNSSAEYNNSNNGNNENTPAANIDDDLPF